MRFLGWAGGVGAIVVAAAITWATPAQPGLPPEASFAVKVVLPEGHGSGVHIGGGYVLTAAHVAASDNLTVETDRGVKLPAEIMWVNKGYDVALLHIDGRGIDSRPLSCAPVHVGAHVTAYGSPLSMEFVSAAGAIVGAPGKRGDWNSVAVVDATVVMGMSGGPVVSDGEVVGLTVGVAVAPLGGQSVSLTGFGFIVPGSEICKLMARS